MLIRAPAGIRRPVGLGGLGLLGGHHTGQAEMKWVAPPKQISEHYRKRWRVAAPANRGRSLTLQRLAAEACLLIVDDDVVELAMTKRGHRGSNMEIVFAQIAREALDPIKQRRFTAGLSDLNLSGEDGSWPSWRSPSLTFCVF